MTLRRKNGKPYTYAAAFLLPVALCVLVFALRGIAPFGDATIMTGDAEYQFVDYFSYLKTIVSGENDFFYSFSKNLGGSMTGFSAYYYFSPVNLITLLFPRELLPLALSVMYALTLGLCSLSCLIFLSACFGFRHSHLIFSLSYAFMGFLTVYFQLTMYYANLILFPLLVLGLIRLTEGKEGSRLYPVCLFLAVLFNYYSGYMICIFSLLMFLWLEAVKYRPEEGFSALFSAFRRFLVSSLAGVFLSAFMLIPAVLSLGDEKNSFSLGFQRLFPLSRLFSGLYTASFRGNVAGGLPNIYCGVLVVLLLFIYFSRKEIPRRERLLSGAFLGLLALNLWLNPLNVVWHGFNQPIGFPYRYSYMVSFLMIFFSCRGYDIFCDEEGTEAGGLRILPFALCLGAFLLYSVFLLAVKSDTVGQREILGDFVLLLAGIGILAGMKKIKKGTLFLGTVLLLLNAAELSFNFYDVLGHFELASLREYREYVSEVGEVIDSLRASDDGFYRMDKFFRRTHNDAMQFDYAGLSHFSSSEKKEKIAFMGRLGFRSNGNWAFYSEPTTVFLDSFFGVKYLLSRQHSIPNDYEKLNHEGDVRIYRNNSALPLMFVCDRGIRDVNPGAFGGNPFALQEAIADSMNGEDNRLLLPAEVLETRVEGLSQTDADGAVLYEKTVPEGEDAKLEFRVAGTEIRTKKGEKANLFVYFDAPRRQNVGLGRYDEDFGDYFDTYRWNIVNLEDQPREEEDGTYLVSLHPREEAMLLSGVYFYYEDRDRSAAFFEKLREHACILEKKSSSHLTGVAEMPEGEESCVVLSIPYDEAWQIFVDGERRDPVRAAGMLLSFDVPSGTHRVELTYHPRGIAAGAGVTLCTLILILWGFFRGRHRKRKEAAG